MNTNKPSGIGAAVHSFLKKALPRIMKSTVWWYGELVPLFIAVFDDPFALRQMWSKPSNLPPWFYDVDDEGSVPDSVFRRIFTKEAHLEDIIQLVSHAGCVFVMVAFKANDARVITATRKKGRMNEKFSRRFFIVPEVLANHLQIWLSEEASHAGLPTNVWVVLDVSVLYGKVAIGDYDLYATKVIVDRNSEVVLLALMLACPPTVYAKQLEELRRKMWIGRTYEW